MKKSFKFVFTQIFFAIADSSMRIDIDSINQDLRGAEGD